MRKIHRLLLTAVLFCTIAAAAFFCGLSAFNFVQAKVRESNVLSNIKQISALKAAYAYRRDRKETDPTIDSIEFAAIITSIPKDVTVKSFDFQNGKISIECVCTHKNSPQEFAARIYGFELFSVVYPTGITQNNGQITFYVVCIY